MSLPTIALTMGDAAGIGPEIIMKALAVPERACLLQTAGDRRRRATASRGPACRQPAAGSVSPREPARGGVWARQASSASTSNWCPRICPSARSRAIAGEAAYRYIERAVRIVEAGEAQAICTAPLSKEALHAAGHRYPGHTELLAALTGTPEVSMMLVAPKLRVIHVTTHIGLLDAIERIDAPLVERVIGRAHETLSRAGISNPRIGVCGINPHAGENGLFGRGEEADEDRARGEECARARLERAGTAAGRHVVLPRGARRLRHRGGDVSRPGTRADQGARPGGRREHHGRVCPWCGPRWITARPSTSPAQGVADERSLDRGAASGRRNSHRGRAQTSCSREPSCGHET